MQKLGSIITLQQFFMILLPWKKELFNSFFRKFWLKIKKISRPRDWIYFLCKTFIAFGHRAYDSN